MILHLHGHDLVTCWRAASGLVRASVRARSACAESAADVARSLLLGSAHAVHSWRMVRSCMLLRRAADVVTLPQASKHTGTLLEHCRCYLFVSSLSEL